MTLEDIVEALKELQARVERLEERLSEEDVFPVSTLEGWHRSFVARLRERNEG